MRHCKNSAVAGTMPMDPSGFNDDGSQIIVVSFLGVVPVAARCTGRSQIFQHIAGKLGSTELRPAHVVHQRAVDAEPNSSAARSCRDAHFHLRNFSSVAARASITMSVASVLNGETQLLNRWNSCLDPAQRVQLGRRCRRHRRVLAVLGVE